MDQEPTKELLRFLYAEGYANIRVVPGHGVCGIFRYGCSIGLCCAMTRDYISYRYCYANENIFDAVMAIGIWDGEGHPSGPWIKRKGRGPEIYNLDYAHNEAIRWECMQQMGKL